MLFNKEDHLKKWVVVFFHLFLPTLFGVLGIILTIQTGDNRDQIERLTDMITELKQQNELVQESISIQKAQYKADQDQIKTSQRPRLKCQIISGDNADIAEATIEISNSGGDISNFKFTLIKGAKINPSSHQQNGVLVSGGNFRLTISKLKDGSGVRLYFTDGLSNKYSQDLIWSQKEVDFYFGIMTEVSK